MENTVNHNQAPVNGATTVIKEFTVNKEVNRKSLREWGFEQAGLNRGDSIALESHLRWIREGHLVDETYSADEEFRRKKDIESQIALKEKEKNGTEKDMAHVKEIVIPDKEKQIAEHKEAIEKKKIGMAEGTIQSTYNAGRFWLYLVLCIFLSIYVIFFYASAINASFFRSMQQLVNNGSGDDITLMLNSIFDVNALFQFGPQSVITYLGAFFFFALGILPHIFHHKKTKFSWLKVALTVLICLVIDSLLAYKIDSGIHELKQMMGIADANWTWYKSVNFYLVLAFGFGAYLVWGFIYEATLAEHDKKDVNVKADIEIRGLKKKIRIIESEIINHKKEITELQKLVDNLKIEIEKLQKALEVAALKPEELLRNMENFYAGWLGFLHGISENHIQKPACEAVYKSFHQSIQAQLN